MPEAVGTGQRVYQSVCVIAGSTAAHRAKRQPGISDAGRDAQEISPKVKARYDVKAYDQKLALVERPFEVA